VRDQNFFTITYGQFVQAASKIYNLLAAKLIRNLNKALASASRDD